MKICNSIHHHDQDYNKYFSHIINNSHTLSQGTISYVYSVGGKMGNIKTEKLHQLDDNSWHDVVIMRLTGGEHYLIVDNVKYATTQVRIHSLPCFMYIFRSGFDC